MIPKGNDSSEAGKDRSTVDETLDALPKGAGRKKSRREVIETHMIWKKSTDKVRSPSKQVKKSMTKDKVKAHPGQKPLSFPTDSRRTLECCNKQTEEEDSADERGFGIP